MVITMNKRDFNKIINSLSSKGKLDIEKVKKLSDEDKDNLVYYIVRK